MGTRPLTAAPTVLVIAGILGLTAAGGTTVSAATPCSATSPLSAQDLRYVREYHRLLGAGSATVWPGWRRVPPLLQRSGLCEYLVGHPAPPRAFSRLPGNAALGRSVYVARAGAVTPGPLTTALKVGASWVAVVPVRDDLQRALDRVPGAGAMRLNDTTYVRSLVHEAFRAHQMTVTRGNRPAFGRSIDEGEATRLLRRLGDAEARLAGEGRALAGAIAAAGLGKARVQAEVFLQRREERRARTGRARALAAFESAIEWIEGTARYADLRLLLLAGARGYAPTRGVRYTPAAASRRAFLRQLGDATPGRDVRERWQDLAAAQGLLLDRLLAGWREAVLPGRRSPEDLLRLALDVPAKLDGLRAAEIAVAGRSMRVALAERPEQWTTGLAGITELGRLDGMLFAFGRDVTTSFWMRGALIPLDVAFFDAGGRLISVETMPLCGTGDCPTYGAPRPYRFALEAPAGVLAGLRPGTRLVAPGLVF